MAMTTKLWSLNSLAVELGVNVRTLGRALSEVRPDGYLGKHPAWLLRTALDALAQRERAAGGDDAVLDELGHTAQLVKELLTRLRDCRSHAEALALLREGAGRCVGRLDVLMARAAAGRQPSECAMLDIIRNGVVGALVAEIFEATGVDL